MPRPCSSQHLQCGVVKTLKNSPLLCRDGRNVCRPLWCARLRRRLVGHPALTLKLSVLLKQNVPSLKLTRLNRSGVSRLSLLDDPATALSGLKRESQTSHGWSACHGSQACSGSPLGLLSAGVLLEHRHGGKLLKLLGSGVPHHVANLRRKRDRESSGVSLTEARRLEQFAASLLGDARCGQDAVALVQLAVDFRTTKTLKHEPVVEVRCGLW